MDPRQRAALQICLPDLMDDLDLQMQYFLCGKGVFTHSDLDLIKAEITEEAQRFKLLKILQTRDNSWNHFLDTLVNLNQRHLAEKLESALASPASAQTLNHNIIQHSTSIHFKTVGSTAA